MRTLKILLTSAYVRGLIGQALFMFGGIAFIGAIRSTMGLDQNVEPGIVFGSILSVFGFLLFAGVLTDWIKWIFGKTTPLQHGVKEGRPEWSRYLNVDVNHKVIGIQYGYTSVLVLLVGGLFALIFRLELAQPGMQLLNNDQYNTLFSAHGIIMIASILLGVGAMINYLVPLMIGASDMAFPRLNAFSYWVGLARCRLDFGWYVCGRLGYRLGWLSHINFPRTVGCSAVLDGFLFSWLLIDCQFYQLISHGGLYAGTWYVVVPYAHFCVGRYRRFLDSVYRYTNSWCGADIERNGTCSRANFLRSGIGGRPHPLSAFVLVLLTSGGVCVCSAWVGCY